MKLLATLVATVACAMLGLVATSTAATLPARAVVITAHVSPSRLGAPGGAVEVTGTVRHAVWCQLKLVSHPSLSVVYSHNPKRCGTGKYSARVLIGGNAGTKDRKVTFTLLARNDTSSFTRSIVLTVAGPGAPGGLTTSRSKAAGGSAGTTTSTTPTTVPSSTTTSAPATSPVIVLPALPSPGGVPGTTLPPTATTTTTSTTTTSTTTALTTTTTGGGTGTTTSTTGLSTTGSSTTTTSGPTTTTTGPTTTTAPTTTAPTTTTPGPPSSPVYSYNWSGYAVASGPYDQVQGTFTVPTLTTAATCTEHVAEWVGIDGWNAPGLAPNDDLIQAGVDASMTDPLTGTCTPGKFYVWPWWEVLPQNETPIGTVTVNADDQVTVSIAEVPGSTDQATGATTWAITLTDDTNGQSYTTDQSYTGPAVSGEWVVEASSTTACAGTVYDDICQLAPYCVGPTASCTGPVSFSNMTIDGAQADWWQVFMRQDDITVATPSVLGANSFSVAYTGSQDAGTPQVDSQAPLDQDGTVAATDRGASLLTAASQPQDKVLTASVPVTTASVPVTTTSISEG